MTSLLGKATFSSLLFILLVSCSQEKTYKPIVKTVFAVSPVSADATSKRTLSGVLQPVDQSVLSFEIPGVVEKVNVNLGDTFAAGDILAKIDDTVFRLAVRQRRGQLSEAKARLTEARLDYERKQQLVGSGAVSQAEVDVAKARFESLKDQVDIATTQLAIAQEDLSDTQMIAPFDGSVAERHVEPSQQISPSTPIFTIQGSDALEVLVFVPESMIGRIKSDDEVIIDVTIDSVKQKIKGNVFERGMQAQRANAFPVTVKLASDASRQLQAGMSAEVTFSSESLNFTENTLAVPLSAVVSDSNNQHFVFALEANESIGLAELRKVPIQVIQYNANSVSFTVTAPLDRIVKNGVEFLREGQQVRVVDDYPLSINQ